MDPRLVVTTAHFNPTLVRLRRPPAPQEEETESPFQSHAGSIEAPWALHSASTFLRNFNPTLVRLRPRGTGGRRGLVRAFQSHAGSIEAVFALIHDRPVEPDFNPTLVRLRRSRAPRASRMMATISIPRWFD